MRDGYVRVAAVTSNVRVADVQYNTEEIIKGLDQAAAKGVKICVFPELAITAYTCGELFNQQTLLDEAKKCLLAIADHTAGMDLLAFVGVPWVYCGKLYNCAAAIHRGKVLGLVTKKWLPNYSEFYERRYFTPGFDTADEIRLRDGNGNEYEAPIGSHILFACANEPDLIVGAEICEDLWVPNPPSIGHAEAGATVIVNCSASDDVTGKADYRRALVNGQSARLIAAYVYANAGEGESTQDLVFGGQNIIAENGNILAESERFRNQMITADVDLERLIAERRRMTTYPGTVRDGYFPVNFLLDETAEPLERDIDPAPFVPSDRENRNRRCEEILMIQTMGLKKRLVHTGAQHAVVGISGGLDSTLALIVTAKAFDEAGIPRHNIIAVTMPGFGTTDRTYNNACELTRRLGAELREVPIAEAVTIHFRDIGQDPGKHDVTYENSQARERTQILMDIANKENGLVIGTGDMSELALGWATYNGDHMSMYGVNAGVPKTLVRHLVRYYADTCKDPELARILLDVLDTPVSPELLPPEKGQISQKTEDLVGPYELHDFFLYYVLRTGFRPAKIYRLAVRAFAGKYDSETILRWLRTFYRRFFAQQFKRSCLPDGPKVGSAAVSPRGDLRMPSDASVRIWMEELEQIG